MSVLKVFAHTSLEKISCGVVNISDSISFRWFMLKKFIWSISGHCLLEFFTYKLILLLLTVGHISSATVTCDYRNICRIPLRELCGMVLLGSGQAGCNLTLFQLHCCISTIPSQTIHLMTGWCWITSEVKRRFPLHARCSLGIYVPEHIVWGISTELTNYWSVLHICLNLHGPVLGDEKGFSYLIGIKCGLIFTL